MTYQIKVFFGGFNYINIFGVFQELRQTPAKCASDSLTKGLTEENSTALCNKRTFGMNNNPVRYATHLFGVPRASLYINVR